jgi:diguanylate cyclase (GGDEF)-like protein
MSSPDALPYLQESLTSLVQQHGLGLAWVGANMRVQHATANLAKMLSLPDVPEGMQVADLHPELKGAEIPLAEILNGKRQALQVELAGSQMPADAGQAVYTFLSVYPLQMPAGVHSLLLVCQQIHLGDMLKLIVPGHGQEVGLEWPRAAMVDPLTRLGNRRAFEQELAARTLEAVNQSSDLTIAVIDLDDFQGFNQRLGLAEGDHLLQVCAQALLFALRRNDTVYRTGDDEFMALLPATLSDDFNGLYQRFEQIMDQVHQEGFPDVNASLGLAAISERHNDPDEALQLAIARLQIAKHSRRTAH